MKFISNKNVKIEENYYIENILNYFKDNNVRINKKINMYNSMSESGINLHKENNSKDKLELVLKDDRNYEK